MGEGGLQALASPTSPGAQTYGSASEFEKDTPVNAGNNAAGERGRADAVGIGGGDATPGVTREYSATSRYSATGEFDEDFEAESDASPSKNSTGKLGASFDYDDDFADASASQAKTPKATDQTAKKDSSGANDQPAKKPSSAAQGVAEEDEDEYEDEFDTISQQPSKDTLSQQPSKPSVA